MGIELKKGGCVGKQHMWELRKKVCKLKPKKKTKIWYKK